MSKRPTFEEFKEKALQGAAFKEAYEVLCPEFELLMKRIKARQEAQRIEKKSQKGRV